MASIAENEVHWRDHDWRYGGDEWSLPFGGPTSHWHVVILPRVRDFVPTGTILEIACGHGRWTEFLAARCDRLIAVDLVPECVQACRRRTAGYTHIEYHCNDGLSLPMVEKGSIDFAFSFDSLVHADACVMSAYMSELARVLSQDGAAFIHHSNLGDYRKLYAAIASWPRVRRALGRLQLLDEYLHWRDDGVTAAMVHRVAENAGLRCIAQELVPWRTRATLIDCFSTIVRAGSRYDRELRRWPNWKFRREAQAARQISRLYAVRDRMGLASASTTTDDRAHAT